MKKGIILVPFLFIAALSLTLLGQTSTPPSPSSPEVTEILKKADTLYVKKMYEEALKEYKKAQALAPQDTTILNKMGIAYQQGQNFVQARKAYERAVKLNGKYAEAWNNLGTVFYSEKNYKKAISRYKKALSLQPQFATAFHNMGAAYFAMNKYEDGFKAYLEAYRLDPNILERTASHGTIVKTAGGNQAMQNFYIAKLFAANGDLERCFLYLQKAHENGYKDWEKLEKDPAFENLIKQDRYVQLKATKPTEL
jgi:Flp pilus assembly protein TadD